MAELMMRPELTSIYGMPPQPSAAPAPQPVFILGCMRSGSSLLGLSLSQHSAFVAARDTTWIERFAMGLQHTLAEANSLAAKGSPLNPGLDETAFFAGFGDSIGRLMAGQSKATRWLDTTYSHAFIAAPLARLFPKGRFIHVVRDVEEVVASLTSVENKRSYRSQHRLLTPQDAYEHWLDVVSAGVEVEHALGSDRVLRVRRNDLLANPELTLRHCLDFIGEAFEPVCLRAFSGLEEARAKPLAADIAVDPQLRLHTELFSRTLINEAQPSYAEDSIWRSRLENAFIARCEGAAAVS